MPMELLNLVISLVVFSVITLSEAKIKWDNVFHMNNYHPKYLPKYVQQEPYFLPKIVGGEEAALNQFPHQVGVFSSLAIGTAFCGGSLISSKYVMTAAHCADGASSFDLVIGAHSIYEPENGSITVTTTKKLIHPEWDYNNLLNDIAILELESAISLSDQIKVIKLPTKSQINELFEDEMSTISGWGKTSDFSGSISPVLRYVENPILSNTACSENMAGLSIPSSQICQSGAAKKGSCNGDSGGPLIVDAGNEIIQVGIVSYGLIYGCEQNYAVAYTRVTSFLSFIEENTDVIIGK